ncbi:uncharacterized protein si:dkey-262k9.2 [Etheostoma cragini]|uniref:uncharacterized protein si:dkey-262k9.2 n=1 Tax=Etheostoma cragini TaxID=417921 RepID=UPI00155DE8B1|nr:uncharacterized protein si:dkey-262k9.2 [Etheostoma cragini]XP_034729053.1 uncharacterized protein si:dkey-262k9.2 [Etheostoma cragini]XP_034729054.1 uncharacterized protein si:dkey-262k9.2 [Etheostoma cragini]XP_034729055.1 uncharacterized protein si:dkey-262k9.2 [Etheostoma cragini]
MMRLLFLCLLLLLPAATALSKEIEGSADGDLDDDEDFIGSAEIPRHGSGADKTTGLKEDQSTMIIIIVAVVALTLLVAVIAAIILVRRHKYNRQQGIYSVPTEQDQKGAV